MARQKKNGFTGLWTLINRKHQQPATGRPNLTRWPQPARTALLRRLPRRRTAIPIPDSTARAPPATLAFSPRLEPKGFRAVLGQPTTSALPTGVFEELPAAHAATAGGTTAEAASLPAANTRGHPEQWPRRAAPRTTNNAGHDRHPRLPNFTFHRSWHQIAKAV